MNKKDEYYFFIEIALEESLDSERKYYYDTMEQVLFCLKFKDTYVLPLFRNEYFRRREVVEALQREMTLVIEHDDRIVLLPKIGLDDKRAFLTAYAGVVQDDAFRSAFLEQAEHIETYDRVEFRNKLKELNIKLCYNYELDIYIYLLV